MAPERRPAGDPAPDQPSLRELVLASHDYASLLANLSCATAGAFGTDVVSGRLLLIHPLSPDVRLTIERRGSVLFHGVPQSKHPCIEEEALLLDGPLVLEKAVGAWLEARGQDGTAYPHAAAILLPLREGGRAVASVVLGLAAPLAPGAVSPASLAALEGILRAAEITLPACRELEMLRHMKDSMQEIFEAATLLEGGEDVRLVARSAVDVMVERLGFERALVVHQARPDADTVVLASHGFPAGTQAQKLPASESSPSLIAGVMREGGVRWLALHAADPLHGPKVPSRVSYHAVALPLLVDGKAVGVLYGDHSQNHAQISPSRLVSLQLFANSVAMRLDSARLLSEVGKLAELDGLTGLPNRRAFDSMLRREVARAQRQQTPLSLLMIDIDAFKELNDVYGHLAGDEVLKETARMLARTVREADFVARFGGDEFVIVMPATDGASAEILSRRVIQATKEAGRRLNRERWHFRLSLGLRSALPHETDMLLQGADTELYRHKESQVRASLLEVLQSATEETISQWNHYLGKLLRVLIEKEPGYLEHARRVSAGCLSIAREMGLRADEVESLHLAAMLHDVGKISIPGVILQRPGPLTAQEFRVVQAHPRIGDDLLREVSYLGDVCEIVRAHHERFDGATTGTFPAYPGEVQGEDIPIGARILKVVDSYDAMTSLRAYRRPMNTVDALAQLEAHAGAAYDRDVVRIFCTHVRSLRSNTPPPHFVI